jgi:acyl-CoA-dependent ceramide synthase
MYEAKASSTSYTSKEWNPESGAWLAPWYESSLTILFTALLIKFLRMRYQIFIPLMLLQLINLFWYFLIWRILLRYASTKFCKAP